MHLIVEEQGDGQPKPEDFNLREYDDRRLNYMKLGQLVSDLGYLPAAAPADSAERELLFDMWNMLQGEELGGVPVLSLKKMLLAVQGICIDVLGGGTSSAFDGGPIQEERNSQISCATPLCIDAQGVLRLSPTETNKIFVKFKPLYVNRVHFLGQFKRVKHVDTSCTFKPQLSRTTE